MTEKTSPGAPLNIAMGGRALLTPLTGIGQYAAHLAREFVQRGHNVRLFYGTHWSSAIADGRAAKPSCHAANCGWPPRHFTSAKRKSR